MKIKNAFAVLFSLSLLIITSCADTSNSNTGSLKVIGPASGDDTTETVYSSNDSFDFGSIPDGTSRNKTANFTIRNDSSETVSLTGSSPVTVSSSNSAFLIDGDQPSASLAAGAEADFTLAFQDNSAVGTEEGVLSIVSDELGTFTLNITGAVAEPGNIEIWGPTDIGNSTLIEYNSGNTYDTQNNESVYTFYIRNTGTGELKLTSLPLEFSGTDPTWFIVTEQPASSVIAAGAEATFKLRFDIITSDHVNKYANLDISSNDPDLETFTLALQGLAS